MTKVSNLSADNESNHDPIDLQLALAQHLSGLKEFGVTIVPARKGESFDIATEAPDATAAPVQPTTTPKPPATPNHQQSSAPAEITKTLPTEPSVSPVSSAPAVEPKHVPLVTQDAPYTAPTPTDQRASALTVIQQEVASCVRCPQLSDDRTNTVFGSGDIQSRLVFLGEGPGEDEDASGLPFQGPAGDMFDRILLACGLKREQVYLLNTIKCRPPKNRNPKAPELENCWGYGQRQLDIIQPEFICCMGSVAAKTLLNTNLSIGKLRKRFHSYRGSKVMVTYHPTYLLRTSSAKTHAWEDMKMLMNEMGIQIPSR